MRINQGQTIYILEGTHSKNVFLHQVFVNKIYIKKAEEKKPEISAFGNQAQGLLELVSSANPIECSLKSISTIIEDINLNSYNITDNLDNVFIKRKQAKNAYNRLSNIKATVEYTQLRNIEKLDESLDISKNMDSKVNIGKIYLSPKYSKEDIQSNHYNKNI